MGEEQKKKTKQKLCIEPKQNTHKKKHFRANNRKTDSSSSQQQLAQHARARSQPLRSKSTALQAATNSVSAMPTPFTQSVNMNRRWVN